MKKILTKSLAVFLSMLMCLTFAPFAFAEGETADEQLAPVFNLELASETDKEAVVTLTLTENEFSCLDFALVANENLQLKTIDLNVEIFIFGSTTGSGSSNINNGMLSIARPVPFTADFKVATYTFEKLTSAGVTADDFSFEITSCGLENKVDVTDITVVDSTLPSEHTHSPADEWFETEASTCSKTGIEVRYCGICGEVAETRDTAKKEHVNKNTDHKDATCTEAGYTKITCLDCGEVISETYIEVAGHSEETIIDRKLPTCTEDGYIKNICTVCNEVVAETVIESAGHGYIQDVQLPTCTEDGHSREYCPSCGDSRYEITLSQTGHSWLDWAVITQPTYAKEGVERRICNNCGADEERSVPKLVAQPTEIILDMNEAGMNFRKTMRLFASVKPDEAAYSTDIIWESSDESVVTVDQEGTVYAVNLGTATVTAKTADGTVSATCEITVTYSFLQWIIIYILFGWIWYI